MTGLSKANVQIQEQTDSFVCFVCRVTLNPRDYPPALKICDTSLYDL